MSAVGCAIPIKRVALKIGSGKTPAGGAEAYVSEGVVFIRSQNVHFDGLRLDDVVFIEADTDATMASTRVLPNDVLLNITGASLGRSAIAPDDMVNANVNQHVCIIRPSHRVAPRFLLWSLRASPIQERIFQLQVGGNRDGLNFEQVGNLPLQNFPVATQRAIADYLDRETAWIDALISVKRRMVELLKERVWVAFGERAGASGPRSVPLRRVLRSLTDGPFGSAFSSADYTDAGAVVIRLGNIGFGYYRDTEEAHISEDLFEHFAQYQVKKGDLLIAGLGDDRNHAGRACVAPELGPAIVKGKCFRARVDPARANTDYLALLLSSPIGMSLMNASGRGSTRSMINLEIVKNTEIPLPGLQAQAAIVADTQAGRSRTDRTTSILELQVRLLQERRQALITGAVTGRLGLPESA